jgi:hypothetical protein
MPEMPEIGEERKERVDTNPISGCSGMDFLAKNARLGFQIFLPVQIGLPNSERIQPTSCPPEIDMPRLYWYD